jgi:hypothetical protein
MMNDFFNGLPLPSIPHGNVVWLVLVAFPVLSIGVMVGRLAWLLIGDWMRACGRRTRLAAEAAELTRYAGEVAVAARRAAATAERHREYWRAASAGVERSGEALDAAEAKARRLAGAAAIPVPPLARTPAEYADRERYLHQAAMAACAHGQLSIYQLSDALAHRLGWDPRLHPACQEVVLSRAIRDHLAATYATAVDKERAAWQALQAAMVAADSLHRAAAEAAAGAELLRPWLEPAPEATAEVTQALPQERPALGWQPAPAG